MLFKDAAEVKLDDEFDLIFIDAAKGQYIKYFEKFCNYLNPGGVIITDNLDFHGNSFVFIPQISTLLYCIKTPREITSLEVFPRGTFIIRF